MQWTVLPHKNVEIVGWVSAAEEKASGEVAAVKRSGREADKRCSLTGPKSALKERQASVFPCTRPRCSTMVLPCVQLQGPVETNVEPGFILAARMLQTCVSIIGTPGAIQLADTCSAMQASAKVLEGRRQKIVRAPGTAGQHSQHSVLQDKLQARMAKQKSLRKRPPALKENQPVEVSLEGSLHRFARGIITKVHNSNSTYDVLLPESGVREHNVPENKIRARQLTKAHFEFAPLVQELRRKVQYDFYDEPVSEDLVSGYYHPDDACNKLSITAWNTPSMCFSWMESKAQMQLYANLAAVRPFPSPPMALPASAPRPVSSEECRFCCSLTLAELCDPRGAG